MFPQTLSLQELILVCLRTRRRWTQTQKQPSDLFPRNKRTNSATLELFNYTSHPQTGAKVCLCAALDADTRQNRDDMKSRDGSKGFEVVIGVKTTM